MITGLSLAHIRNYAQASIWEGFQWYHKIKDPYERGPEQDLETFPVAG